MISSRSSPISTIDYARVSAALDQTLKNLNRQISHYFSSDRPIWFDSADSSSFLDAVDEHVSAIPDWTNMAAEKPVTASLDRAEDLLQQAMFRLEDEFKSLMERDGESLDMNLEQPDLDLDMVYLIWFLQLSSVREGRGETELLETELGNLE